VLHKPVSFRQVMQVAERLLEDANRSQLTEEPV